MELQRLVERINFTEQGGQEVKTEVKHEVKFRLEVPAHNS
jgi:hypothetical protein